MQRIYSAFNMDNLCVVLKIKTIISMPNLFESFPRCICAQNQQVF